jgi:tetratricopeptide (TPR) repeat protein
MKLSRAALAAAIALGVSGPALGQQPAAPAPPAPPVRAVALSPAERHVVAALGDTLASPDRAVQDQAIAAARAAVRSPEGRYAVGYYQLQIADRRGDASLRAQAVDMLVDSGLATADEIGPLLASQASRSLASGDLPRTERLVARMVELQPNNPVALADYAELKVRMGEPGNGVLLLVRAVAAAQASGRPAPESWHLRGLALAFDARMAAQAGVLARSLVANYPSPVNWRDALLAYRELAPADPTLGIDVQRLMRASQALSGERDYNEYAEAAVRAQQIGEAKAVLDEGVSRGMIETARIPRELMTATAARAVTAERGRLAASRTAALAPAGTGQQARTAGDLHFGNGLYAEAAELYRAALQKGGEDANLVNSRLGAALALAGRRAEAEAALRTVTGPRADLAGFWLAWLSRRPAV